MTFQLSMLDLLEPAPVRPTYVPPVTREVMTRAYGRNYPMQIAEGDPDPFEMEIAGTPCLITLGYGFSTYAIQPVGSLFWSETGFRNFSFGGFDAEGHFVRVSDREQIESLVRAHIKRPITDLGLGGKLVRWWPSYVRQWQQRVSFHSEVDRETFWAHFGPEKEARLWAKADAEQAAALARMWAEGIDPNDVGKPQGHKGKWPKFEVPA